MSMQAVNLTTSSLPGSGSGAVLKGAKQTGRWLKAKKTEAEKAMNTALKVEGFRLRKDLQKEIRAGAPGGRRFDPLSYISRGLHRRRLRPDRPLASMATAVRYAVTRSDPYTVKAGFIQPGGGFHGISKRWIALAKMHQEGFDRGVTSKMRKMIVRWGARLGTVDGGDTPFFLKKNTARFKTPARPIIAPFWQAHKNRAKENIQRNFRQKMKGQRI
jgi:hypothetical protein